MERRGGMLAAWAGALHGKFLPLLVGSYVLAAVAPGAGLWIRGLSLGEVHVLGTSMRPGLPMVLLSALLLNAGLGVRASSIGPMLARPRLLGAGLLANVLVPIGFILAVRGLLVGWHSREELQSLLVGLGLVASMPIAGSSAAWSQNADGEAALSLGLVLASTLLSPLTTPLGLHAVAWMTGGEFARDLHAMAAGGVGLFLGLCVLSPSLAGIGLRAAIGDRRYQAARPGLKLANLAILLVLNYANASASLPRTMAHPDPDFLAAILAVVVALCGTAFGAGWAVSRLLGASRPERTALMFGLGMNNNGTGLVLASMAMADHPRVMLPIIASTLVQHLAAGVVDRQIGRPPRPGAGSGRLAAGAAAG